MGDALEEAERLFAMGEDLADAQEDGAALRCFCAAWDALPEPRDEQGPAVLILAAIADTHFHLGEWDGCRAAVQHAFRCGADVANPFLRLRLGQALYELGNQREAENWLVPAYLSESPHHRDKELVAGSFDPFYHWARTTAPPNEAMNSIKGAAADRPRD